MPMSAMKAAFKLPSAARLINKEGRGDFRKEIPLHYFLNTLLKQERYHPNSFCNLRESSINSSLYHLKESKNQ